VPLCNDAFPCPGNAQCISNSNIPSGGGYCGGT
jgi:hypothetical protein